MHKFKTTLKHFFLIKFSHNYNKCFEILGLSRYNYVYVQIFDDFITDNERNYMFFAEVIFGQDIFMHISDFMTVT